MQSNANQWSQLAVIAAEETREAGGFLSFEDYKKLGLEEKYFTPFDQESAEELGADANLCAEAAIVLGLLKKTENGYRYTKIA